MPTNIAESTLHIYWQESHDPGSGLYCQNLIFPKDYWPVTVKPGEIWERREWKTSMNRMTGILGIWTFLGHDRGDVAESDINVETETGIPLVQRSEHRIFTDYDADVYYDVSKYGIYTQNLRMWLKCGPTTDKPVRYHVGIRVIGR